MQKGDCRLLITRGQEWLFSATSWSMATQAAELAPVAHRTGGFVEVQLPGRVVVEEARNVGGRFQRGIFGVALFAAEGCVDLGVADQAVGHLRHIRRAHLIRLLHPAMAGLAGISGVQVGPDVLGRLEVSFPVDGRGD